MDVGKGALSVRASIIIGQNEFVIDEFQGSEHINQPFNFKVVIAAPSSIQESLIGHHAQLILSYANISKDHHKWPNARQISGIITAHQHHLSNQHQTNTWALSFEPQMCKANLSGKPRVFRNLSSLELADKLLHEQGYARHQLQFPKQKDLKIAKLTHWVQAANETDFQMIQRVLSRDGINYFWQLPNAFGEEIIHFFDKHHMLPTHQNPLQWHVKTNLTGHSHEYLFDFSMCHKPLNYQVTYIDFDPQNPDKPAIAFYGTGEKKVRVCGFGAQSHEDLQRAVRIHHERLAMDLETYTAQTHNINIQVGHLLSIKKLPGIRQQHFYLSSIKHFFKNGTYYNQIKCLTAQTPIRPIKHHQKAGQIIHTATIHGEDDTPNLSKTGEYEFSNHIHFEDTRMPEKMTAQRLSPYGGTYHSSHLVGMHFPLKNQAEVLVMYLHNDFNQPILQNSPDNGINCPPVTQKNPWQNMIKTAWEQYLLCSEQKNQPYLKLAGVDGYNHLTLAHRNSSEPYVALMAERGEMSYQACHNLHIQSDGSLFASSKTDVQMHANKRIKVNSEQAHLQASESHILALKKLDIQSEGQGEIKSPVIQLKSQHKMAFITKGKHVNIETERGDMAIEVDEIHLSANDDIKLVTSNAAITINQAGIAFNAQYISFKGATTLGGELIELNEPVPPVITTTPTLSAPTSLRPYPFDTLQIINKPNWSHCLHFKDEMATLEVDIRGFSGHETGQVIISRYQSTPQQSVLPVYPPIRQLKDIEQTACISFTLGEKAIYESHKAFHDTPGDALLSINIPVEQILSQPQKAERTAHDAYYARVEINGISGDYYSGPLLIVTKATVEIVTDRNLAYQNPKAVLGMMTHLPDNLKQHQKCPTAKTIKFYREDNTFNSLLIGQGHEVYLAENGMYRELLGDVKTIPLPKQNIQLESDDKQKKILKRFMPPMIMDIRHASKKDDRIHFEKDEPNARVRLQPDEIEYIKNNGNNLMVFIHGFNVEMGAFHKHFDSIDEQDIYPMTPSVAPRHVVKKLQSIDSEADATIVRDQSFFDQQFPALKSYQLASILGSINGTGVCEWVTHLEKHLNEAAGFDGKDYGLFTRCLFLVWPGNPASPLNYIEAVRESVRMGPIVADILEQIMIDVPGINLNVMAHSQGNGVMLHALEQLGENNLSIDHAIFWQAAIPNDALSDRNMYQNPMNHDDIYKAQQTNPWFCPYAHLGSKQFSIFYSQNDNVLGGLLTQQEQPEGVKIRDVWHAKPIKELTTALLLSTLSLESLYQVANKLNMVVSDFFDQTKLENIWCQWITHHPTFYCIKTKQHHKAASTLESQYKLLVALGQDGFNDGLKDFLERGKIRFKQLMFDYFFDEPNEKIKNHMIKHVELPNPNQPIYNAASQLKDALSQLFKFLNAGRDDLMAKIKLHAFKYLEKQSPTVAHLTTFMHSVLVMSDREETQAMGYQVLDQHDPTIKKLTTQNKLHVLNTTRWLWEHSHMKVANKAIKANIYKQGIFDDEHGIKKFGKYNIPKNR